jgi:hypothetical protein
MSARAPKVISISEAARREQLYELPPSEVAAIGESNHIYGTLTSNGLQTTADAVTEFFGDTEAIIGCDVGCGDGELIYHLSRLLAGSKWSGFEISAQRVGMCCWHEHVSVWQGDCLKEHYADFNVLHINDLMFDDELAMELEAKVAREFSGLLITYRAITAPSLRRLSQHLADVPTVSHLCFLPASVLLLLFIAASCSVSACLHTTSLLFHNRITASRNEFERLAHHAV